MISKNRVKLSVARDTLNKLQVEHVFDELECTDKQFLALNTAICYLEQLIHKIPLKEITQ